MTVAGTGFNHRHPGVVHHGTDQSLAAARHEDVDQPPHLHQRLGGGTGGILDQLDGFRRQTGFCQGTACQVHDSPVGFNGFLAAAEHHGITALDAQSSHVGGHVGTGFKNHAHHAHRHTHTADGQSVGACPAVAFAYGIVQTGDILRALRHTLDTGVSQAKAVQHRILYAVFFGICQVFCVCRKYQIPILPKQLRKGAQRLIFYLGACSGQSGFTFSRPDTKGTNFFKYGVFHYASSPSAAK